ncbi:326_t:CDS:2, partial [Entrophospora sp. SA101]
MPSQLTGIIIVNNYKEKFTEKYKIVSGEELEEFFDLEFIIFQPISEEYTKNMFQKLSTKMTTTIGYVSDDISVTNEGTSMKFVTNDFF